MAIDSEFSHEKKGVSFHSYLNLPEGNIPIEYLGIINYQNEEISIFQFPWKIDVNW